MEIWKSANVSIKVSEYDHARIRLGLACTISLIRKHIGILLLIKNKHETSHYKL